ncbi:unnamed protein product [Linum tenue]|uniref:TIR domain-containing protein n=1 Tax=Linum tenue TaxID=586396 RepID=A0AAV0KGB6_9ROSI|nr:unnamed protein product [Linum tenue]
MDTNWHSFLATAALLVAAVSILYRRQKKNSSSKPSPESNSSLSDFDSSTRPLPAGNYEVFLSFRGPDVRTTFADSLYHFLDHSKIRTFFDDEGLRKGEKIAPSLVQAIQESKIYIPILSQGYASSKWCLEELSLMVKSLNQNQGHILLPIFYFVEPRDVRRQEGSYSRAFRQHSRNHDAETVKEWKEALQVVSNMKGWHVTESDGKILPNIRWLQLCLCRSIPTDVNLKKVIILNLEGSYVRDDWKGWKRVKEGKKLKVVNLRQCEDLVKAPDLSSCGRLEVINLELCTKMGGELHIGNFKNLKLLRLSSSKITELKGDIQMLQDLEEIDASNLTEMPAGIALPTSLKKLWLSSPSVPNLLELKDLEDLCFQHCHGAPEIPGDIWLHLTKLKKLTVSFSYCNNGIMGDSVAKLPSSLNSLVVSCMQLETLPDLANLSNLIELRLRSVQVDEIHGVGQLKMLEAFAISDAPNLKSLDGLENLVLLQRLTVVYCGALEKLPSISNLTKLHTLVIRSCWALFEIQGLDVSMESLERLELHRCTSMKKLPNLCHLKKLNCLSISECRSLTSTEDCGIDGLNSLQRLNISWCTSILKLPNLCGLTKLTNMDIIGCTKVTEVMGLERLESLVRLKLNDCASIVRLPDLSALKNLTLLNISGCTQLTEVTGLESLESLQVLAMSRCKSVSKLPDLSILEYLRYLNISKCTQLKEVIGVERLEWLELLAMSQCKSIKQLPDLSGLKYLKHLDIRQCRRLTEIKGLQELKSLEVLGVHDPISAPGLMDGMSELHQKYLM